MLEMDTICQTETPTSCTLKAWGTSYSPFSLALTNFLNEIFVLCLYSGTQCLHIEL